MVTDWIAPLLKHEPVIVTGGLLASSPVFGEIASTVGGAEAAYVYEPPVAVAPPGLVTVILYVPAEAAAPVTTNSVFELTYVTAAAVVPPIVTVAPLANPVPVIVTIVVPSMSPVFGDAAATAIGGGSGPSAYQRDWSLAN